ncbi:RnfH family protein [Kangiella shandongensis]|uniref:RnfH family protein n=1 Tax=Kangiella shandongensis TaxID=2763258 RepID=UPI001CBE4302|nr:RnfH family protein [Kangiella shandongensis]
MEQSSKSDIQGAENCKLKVEVAYALPEKQTLLQLEVRADATIEDVISQSGILDLYPEIDLNKQKVGIFSKLAKLGDHLHDGDRVEIYRPLLIDPKEVRKQRAQKARQETKK